MPMTDDALQLDLAVHILGNETRRAIFEALWRESQDPDLDQRGLTFAELKQAVDVDSGSRLSYHLDEMNAKTYVVGLNQGQLVAKKNGRYQLHRIIGKRILQLWALALPEHADMGPTEVPWDCPHCGKGLTAQYKYHRLTMDCPDHPGVFFEWALPGDTAGQSMTDIVRLAAITKARRFRPLLAGRCNACWAPIDRRVLSHEHGDSPVFDALDESVTYPHTVADYAYSLPDHKWYEPFAVECRCQQCEQQVPRGLGYISCYRPPAANFLAANGFNIHTDPMHFRFIEHSGVVLSSDPPRFQVRLRVDNVSRTFVVDDRAQIISEGNGEPTHSPP